MSISTVEAPVTTAAVQLLAAAQRELTAAVAAQRPEERYARAHLGALRAAAAFLAARARPARSRPRSVWVLLPAVAPELHEWAIFFAASAAKRPLAEAGVAVVSDREADDLLRGAYALFDRVATMLHIALPAVLPVTD